MANITNFSVQSPYDQQMEELKRRQRMAELMQQEAMQPLESQVAPGGMVVPTSPVLGLAKLLQGYMSGKQLRDIEKQRGETEQRAGTEAMDFLRTIRQGEPNKDAALAASLSPTPTESIRVPLSPTERQTRIESAFLGGSPQMKLAAQLASMKPEQPEAFDVKYETSPNGEIHAVQYLKTGERKDLGAATPYEKPVATPKKTIERKTRTSSDAAGNEVHQDYNFDPTTGEETLVGKPYLGKPKAKVSDSGDFNRAEALRKEYTGQTSQYRSIADAYQKIQKAAANPSPANDISLVYGFMRINDPTSTVREGEYATAENSGGVPARIRNLYNKIINGERLTPDQRTDFVNSAQGLIESQRPNLKALSERYSDIARRNKLLPEDIVFDPFQSIRSRKTINGVTYENRGKGPNDWHKVEEQ